MLKKILVLDNVYCGESIVDLSRDIHECIDSRFNPAMKDIPVDEYGFLEGEFQVMVIWKGDK